MNSTWVKSPIYDWTLIILVPFWCILYVFYNHTEFTAQSNINEVSWLILVVVFDVGHVYTTLFKTYLDRAQFIKYKFHLLVMPFFFLALGVSLHFVSPLFYWRCLTYFAVFHFVRQQYGLMRLYSKPNEPSFRHRLDAIAIYSSTIVPLLYWHLTGPKNFNWFVSNDFIFFINPIFANALLGFYFVFIALYLFNEIYFIFYCKQVNFPKLFILLGTGLSWYFGIIYFKSDLAFTFLNVVCHGIPYYALVWATIKRKSLIFFIGLVCVLAYLEELLWDGFVWQDHFSVFPTTYFLSNYLPSSTILSLIIPLLTLPQLMHYYLDGLIWKKNPINSN